MTFLQGRPWLLPCLLIVFLGGMQLTTASTDSNPTVQTWLGVLAVIAGVLMLAAAEHAHRKYLKSLPGSAEDNADPSRPSSR